MDAHKQTLLAMFKSVIKISDDNTPIVSTRAGYMSGLGLLRTVVIQIEASEGPQTADTTGSTADRKTKYLKLGDSFYHITSGAAGYAGFIENETLFNKFNRSRTDINDIGFDTIAGITDQLILDVTETSLVTPLLGWDVTVATLADLSLKLHEYRDDYSAPRDAIIDRETQTQEVLPPLYFEGLRILEKIMDKAAVTLKKTHAIWYGSYQHSRSLIGPNRQITTVKGLVTSSTTGLIIPNPKAVSSNGQTTQGDINGSYIASHYHPGDSSITYSATGFTPKTTPLFHIKPGQTIHTDITLDPI